FSSRRRHTRFSRDWSSDVCSSDLKTSIGNTPILTAAQDGIPASLRFSEKTDFAPRFGFAWRATADGKTAIRGGAGRFIEAPLGEIGRASCRGRGVGCVVDGAVKNK